MEIYQVKAEDTLEQIARQFGVPVESIASINGLDPLESLVVGMNLVIPLETVMPTITYTVQPGDTIFTIANRYNTTVTQIADDNGLISPYAISPGQVLVIRPGSPIQPKPTIETLGYYNPSAAEDKTALINQVGQYLTYLGIFDFPITATGKITGTIDEEVLEAAILNNVIILPVLTNLLNGEFNSDLARTVLSNETILNTFLDNIIVFLEQYGLDGVIIDFENLYPEDRNIFTRFIRLLYERLHSVDKILILNIAAKWEDLPDAPWAGFFDYRALSQYMDRAAIMTYEWGYRTGPPFPIAPLPYVRRVLDYAIANNITANKILMGMIFYGYNWQLPYDPNNLATTVTLPRVWDLARRYNANIVFDDESKSPHITYIDENNIQHEVWFEDALSHYLKYQLVIEYNLRGVFYWIINQPFEATWYMVSNLFAIEKGT